jgi:hypothetical protein
VRGQRGVDGHRFHGAQPPSLATGQEAVRTVAATGASVGADTVMIALPA